MSEIKKQIHQNLKNNKTNITRMLIIKVKEGESIERALKRYKRKHRNVKVINEIRGRKEYMKKSVKRRKEIQKAAYVQKLKQEKES